jgi:putative ABC transport system permease protein
VAYLTLAIRRLFRHWRLNLVLLAGLTLAAALLAALPSFAATTATAALVQALQNEPPQARNLQVSGPRSVMTGLLSRTINEGLGNLVTGRLEVSFAQLSANALHSEQVIPVDSAPRAYFNDLVLWSFDRQTDLLDLVAGKWPAAGAEPKPVNPFAPLTIQVAMAKTIAERAGFKLGDMLRDESGTKYKVVGIFERKDPQDPLWWQDERPFDLWIIPGLNEDTLLISLLAPQAELRAVSNENVDWRILIDQSLITPDQAAEVEKRIINVKAQVDAAGASMQSVLPDLLGQYQQNLSRVRSVLFLLSAQAYAFVLYTLAVLAGLANRQSESEIVTLAGRGAGAGLITFTFSLDRLVLALLAGLLLGPLAAMGGLLLWSRLSGEPIPASLPLESYLLALGGALIGWLALTLPVLPAARKSILEWQHQRARPETLSAWQRHYVDIFLLILGGLAYWQLSSTGSFVFHSVQDTALADPLLLLGPTLLLIALALVFLRIFPYILRFFAWLARGTRGLVLKLGLARLARDPINASQMVLLVSIAVGLSLFSVGFGDSLHQAQVDVAHYRVGADLRILQGGRTLEEIAALPGVISAVPVFRAQVRRSDGNDLTMLAVDTRQLAQVTSYPPGMSNLTIASILGAVRVDTPGSGTAPTPTPQSEFGQNPYIDQPQNVPVVPAVFSFNGLISGVNVGDKMRVTFRGEAFDLEVHGIVADFPTLSNRYVIIDRKALGDLTGLDQPGDYRSREVWLSVAPGKVQALAETFRTQGLLLGAARDELQALQTNALAWGTQRAFTLNALVLGLLSVVGFLLISYFNARQRMYEFGVLRAGGLSARQLVGLLSGEGLLVLGLGFLAGTVIGYGLLQLMRIYLSQVLSQVLPGIEVRQLVFDLASIFRVYGILILFYGLALALLLVSLLRSGIQRTLRIGDE